MELQISLEASTKAVARKLDRLQEFRRLQGRRRGMRRRVLRFLRRGEQGAALVEFALILPALLALVTGILSMGVAFNNDVMLTNAVNQGALAVQAGAGYLTDPCATAASAIIAASPILDTKDANGVKVTMSFNSGASTYGPSAVSGFTCNAGALALAQGTTVTVSATYPCKLGVYGMNFSGNCQLSAQTSELVQ
jgi:Flp pilus assembly protein TadG